jgi:ketosteroid isomerase-like protein
MKTKFERNQVMFLIFTIVFLLSCFELYAETLEEELQNHMNTEIEAWNNRDIDKISGGWSVGFGFRTIAPRGVKPANTEMMRSMLKKWFDTLEHYKVILLPEESNIMIDGDIGLVWGFHIEEVKHKGRPAERIKVRSSATYRRNKDGVWHQLLGHRDIQRFQDNGFYIPVYEE